LNYSAIKSCLQFKILSRKYHSFIRSKTIEI
jgi:hypothetical protein